MSDISQFALNSPWLTFFIVYVVVHGVVNLINRMLRHINIAIHGYPPPHCDADGDFKPQKDAS